MKIKKEFELIYKTTGTIYNILPLASSTLKAYQLSKDDVNHLNSQVHTYNRIKPHPASGIVEREMDKVLIIDFGMYPLPGSVTNKGISIINVSSLPQKFITDYNPVDILSMYIYSIALKKYVIKKPFSKDNIESISAMIFSIFMKLFGKVGGLTGSYRHLIPRLQFLIKMYVNIAFMGEAQTENLKKKIGSSLYIDYKNINLDFDFNSIKEFLNSINKNQIISISENTFSTKIINTYGVAALPMFEDVSRFFAGIIASTVPGNALFSSFIARTNKPLFQKLVYMSLKTMGK